MQSSSRTNQRRCAATTVKALACTIRHAQQTRVVCLPSSHCHWLPRHRRCARCHWPPSSRGSSDCRTCLQTHEMAKSVQPNCNMRVRPARNQLKTLMPLSPAPAHGHSKHAQDKRELHCGSKRISTTQPPHLHRHAAVGCSEHPHVSVQVGHVYQAAAPAPKPVRHVGGMSGECMTCPRYQSAWHATSRFSAVPCTLTQVSQSRTSVAPLPMIGILEPIYRPCATPSTEHAQPHLQPLCDPSPSPNGQRQAGAPSLQLPALNAGSDQHRATGAAPAAHRRPAAAAAAAAAGPAAGPAASLPAAAAAGAGWTRRIALCHWRVAAGCRDGHCWAEQLASVNDCPAAGVEVLGGLLGSWGSVRNSWLDSRKVQQASKGFGPARLRGSKSWEACGGVRV